MTINDATSCKKPCSQVTIAATLESRHQSWTQIRPQQRYYKHIVSHHWICTLNRTKSRRQAWKTTHASNPKTYKKTKRTINSPSITGLWHQAPSKNYSAKKRLQRKLEMTGKNQKKNGAKEINTRNSLDATFIQTLRKRKGDKLDVR